MGFGYFGASSEARVCFSFIPDIFGFWLKFWNQMSFTGIHELATLISLQTFRLSEMDGHRLL